MGLVLIAIGLSFVFALPALALALVLGVGVAYARTPLAPLVLYFVLFGLTLGHDPRLQVEEVVFLVYHIGYLATWYILRLFVFRERLVRSVPDVAVVTFLLLLAFSVLPTILLGGNLVAAANEGLNFSMVAVYFPIREACARYRWGPRTILIIIGLYASIALIQNLYILREVFAHAEMAWQYARARVAMSEMLLTSGAVGSLALTTVSQGRVRIGFLIGFALFAGGLILTQSRAYYVDLLFGVFVLLVIAPIRQKGFLTLGLIGGGALVAGVAWLIFGDRLILIGLGILDRVLSIGSAITSEVSFLNRALESEAIRARIRTNPILGHGLGVSFSFHDALYDGTWTKTYAHNGFLTLWFKLGLGGLGAIVILWASAAWKGFRTAWSDARPPLRGAGLVAGVVLLCLVPSHFSSATFSTADTLLCFTLLAGLGTGTRMRALFESER